MENIHHLLPLFMGAALLLAGRHFFWLFVGFVGFVLGVQFLAPLLMGGENTWLSILAGGLIGGVLGALLAIFAQGVAIVLAGFWVGGQILIFLAQSLISLSQNAHLVFFVIGGIAGAIFLLMFFDLALIVMTSLWGASLLVNQFSLASTVKLTSFVLLVILGIAIQTAAYKRLRI